MEETTRVIEIQKTFERKIEDKKVDKIILENIEGKWFYHAPNAQNHSIEQLEEILNELKKMS